MTFSNRITDQTVREPVEDDLIALSYVVSVRASVRPLTLVAVAVAVTMLAVLAGVLVTNASPSPSPGADPDGAGPPPSVALRDLDTSALAVRRAAFCDAVAPERVVEALGSPPTHASEHAPGERAQLTPELLDVAHEHACSWAGGDASARAWVFGPPVAPGQARALARAARAASGCSVLPDAPAYGAASLALACRTDRGLEVSWRGLFGDAWLTCSLLATEAPRADLVERAGRWCATVARAAA